MASKNSQKYALISVFDKTGIVDFARSISSFGYKIISTGGTAKVLLENNIKVIPIAEITKNPESFDGRMKTISFQVESGILFDRTKSSHRKQAKNLKIKPIDIVVCNLYPFEKKQTIENIDVGGPTMIRAAGKNFKNVFVAVDPNDYLKIIRTLKANKNGQDMRKKLAAKAFAHLSSYDSQIARFLETNLFPKELTISGRKTINLRYGENPHQIGVFYTFPNSNSPLKNLKKEWGRELSYVNLTDINAGIESVRLFREPAAAVIKHNSPCGLALGKDAGESLKRAIDSDPESAFGGIIVLNKIMNLKAASIIGRFKSERHSNVDIVAVPQIESQALAYLSRLRKSMGIYTFGNIINYKPQTMNYRWVNGGFIIQTIDNDIENGFKDWKIVTQKRPSAHELKQMKIAWKFISRIRSNTIVVLDKKLPMIRGIGSGQTSRIRSTRIALEQAGKFTKNAILASDSFFPFDDSVKLAAEYGISTIVQQGGSINDKSSIETANKKGISMIFTNRRAFWH